jgi:protease I
MRNIYKRGFAVNLLCLVLLVSSIIFVVSLSLAQEQSELEGKKVLIIIASSNFRDEEYSNPRQVLENKGAKITVASSKDTPSVGMLKKETVKPDTLLSKVKAEDYDAVVFIGGVGAKEYFADQTAHKIAREAVKKNKILAAICIAPSILANAGVLSGKKVTAFQSEAENLKAKGANYTGAPVEVDGKIITANGPEAAEKFARKIVELLKAIKKLEGKKILMIIAFKDFQDEELKEPKESFENDGAEVTVASTEKKEAVGINGMKLEVKKTLEDVKVKDLDAIVFVGGTGAKQLFNDKTAAKLAKSAAKAGKVVAAICTAPSILANAGLLKGKNATAFESEKENLQKNGAKFSKDPVVTDGKIVTANGPEASKKFAEAVTQAILSR